MFIVFAHQPVRNFEVVNVSKDEGAAVNVGVLALDEGEGLVAPVTEGIQMVGGVVPVIEAEAVGLDESVSGFGGGRKEGERRGLMERRGQRGV